MTAPLIPSCILSLFFLQRGLLVPNPTVPPRFSLIQASCQPHCRPSLLLHCTLTQTPHQSHLPSMSPNSTRLSPEAWDTPWPSLEPKQLDMMLKQQQGHTMSPGTPSLPLPVFEPLTFMVGGAVRGGDSGRSGRVTSELLASSCFLQRDQRTQKL